MNPYAITKETAWLNECVALFQDGTVIYGDYDGYGRVNDYEIDYHTPVDFQHKRCWEKNGSPIHFETASTDAKGQGHFYDDGDPPERTWRDALTDGSDDVLETAAANAEETAKSS